jgi:hypothetical protein
MKAFRELKLKKIFKSLLKGSFKTKAFLISFGIFFSTLAFAAALSVTWLSRHMGGNPASIGLTCYAHPNSEHPDPEIISADGAQDPTDIAFSNDGLTYFTANQAMQSGYDITMYKLTSPFDLSTLRNDCSQSRFDLGLLAQDGGAGGARGSNDGSVWGKLFDMEFSPSGHKLFLVNGPSYLMQFSLSTPFDLATATFDTFQDLTPNYGSVAFNRDGTKMFWLEGGGSDTADATKVETYDLGSPFDITSLTLVHTLDLSSTALNSADGNQFSVDMNFNDTGSAFYILINDGEDETRSAIYQFSLEKNYDMSTASLLGSVVIIPDGRTYGVLEGFEFGDGGMKLYVIDARGGTGVDQTNVYQLECPYGVVECVSNPTASISSQVELAKQNIALNISSIFYRFEWIKRNRDEENFTSHNININYPNPLLKSLAMSLKPAAKEKIATLVSTPKKDQKKSKWSSWSLGDLSLSHFDKLGFENAKNIRNEGITFGADRKFSDNKFFGWAIRYGNGRSNIAQTKQNIHMDSLTLNLYGIMPKDKENYLNAVLGLSALKIDSLYLGKKSGQRYGKQLFTAIDFRTKNSYGKLNLTPTTKFTFGITRLGEYTDFLSDAIDSPTQNIRYDKDTFTTGQISSGFLFEADQITINDKFFQPMGGMEIYYDLSRDINYNYSLVGSNQVNTDTIDGAYNRANLKTSLGFELIYPDGLTLSPLYEKTFALKGSNLNDVLLSKGVTERFIIKISRSKETDGNNFALDFDPLNQNYANISFNKNLGNLNIKLNSNYSLFSKIPDYGANLEISGTF